MDRIRLEKYRKKVSLAGNEINSFHRGASKSGTNNLKNSEITKAEIEFFEYLINDKPLSELLGDFYNSKRAILDNWIGALGSNPRTDIIKVNQLLVKEVSDKEIRQVYPSTWTDEAFSWYLDKYREELKNPEVLIYCCAQCGDYDCGGIAVYIDRTDTSFIWTIKESDKELRFEFDKYLYFETFNKYLRMLT